MPKVAANIGPLVVGAVATLYRGYDLCAAEEDLETKREEERDCWVPLHNTPPLSSPLLPSPLDHKSCRQSQICFETFFPLKSKLDIMQVRVSWIVIDLKEQGP